MQESVSSEQGKKNLYYMPRRQIGSCLPNLYSAYLAFLKQVREKLIYFIHELN